MVEVYREPLCRRFVAPRLSITYCFKFLSIVCTIVLPYVLCYASGSFFLKQNSIRTQPDVRYTHTVLLQLQGNEVGKEYLWSTSNKFNRLFGKKHRAATIESWEEDSDNDGRADKIHLHIECLLQHTAAGIYEAVNSAVLFVGFNYQLGNRAADQKYVRLQMDTLLTAQHTSPQQGHAVHFDGHMVLKQRHAIFSRPRPSYSAADTVLNEDEVFGVSDISPQKLYARILDRNVSAVYESPYAVWSPGTTADGLFHVHATVRIPAQDVAYVPDFIETIKFAWMQYLCVAFLIWLFFEKSQAFIFRYQVLPARILGGVGLRKPNYKF